MELILTSKKYGTHTVLYDDKNRNLIKKHKWSLAGRKEKLYCISIFYDRIRKKTIRTFMHNIIMKAKGIDHKNGNGLDNREENLRIATQRQNNKNMKISRLNKFGVKGASFCKSRGVYSVHITCDYKHIFLGYYSSLVECAKKYNEAAIRLHGDFANLNDVTPERIIELEKLDLNIEIKRRKRGKTSKYKGVYVSGKYYISRITKNGKVIYLGCFKEEIDAHLAYQLAIKNK